jgi:hypothetical protein
MASAARLLAKQLSAAGVGPDALRQAVIEMSAARADAINQDGLEAQCAYLLECFGPNELLTQFSPSTDNCQSAAGQDRAGCADGA